MADDLFLFQADTFEEKEGWIGAIGKALIKNSKGITMDNQEIFKTENNS